MTERLSGPAGLERAAGLLCAGELVAIPTETVYGLAARASDDVAVARIFVAKGRPTDNPLIVHIADGQVDRLVSSWPESARRLAEAFWPGPLTLVTFRHEQVPAIVSAGRNTIAVRWPAHPLTEALIRRTGPLAAPSANRSGRPSPTTPQHVLDDLDGSVAAVLDGGPCEEGLESTVVDVTVKPPVMLRPGSITLAQLQAVIGAVELHPSVLSASAATDARAPGMRYRHYSPDAEVVLLEGEGSIALAVEHLAADRSAHAVLVGGSDAPRTTVFPHADALGRALYGMLRDLDAAGVTQIVFAGIPDDAVAVLNRLRKASSRV